MSETRRIGKEDIIRRAATLFLFMVGTVSLALGPRITYADRKIIHDAEYYILEAQNGEKWAAEDWELDKKLADLKKKYGGPPNIIHIMWEDTV